MLPPSGDKHDYCSLGRYWWPNPDTLDGLPWVRRDGHTNPLTQDNSTDRHRLDGLYDRLEILTLAWLHLGDRQAGELATTTIRTWFLHADTRMNPNLNYSQGIPGREEGRCLGMIDTRGFIDTIEQVEVLTTDGFLNANESAQFAAWISRFLHWLRRHPFGAEESQQHNNHGSWHDAQTIAYALAANDEPYAKHIAEQVPTLRYAAQSAVDGSQPHEAARELSWDYHGVNLFAWVRCADAAEYLRLSLWDNPQLLRAGLFFAQFDPHKPAAWPWTQVSPVGNMAARRAISCLAIAYPDQPTLHANAEQWLTYSDDWCTALRYPLPAQS